ncbi:hypothetical protein QFC21_004571, partial [Naganishia friedmannii]
QFITPVHTANLQVGLSLSTSFHFASVVNFALVPAVLRNTSAQCEAASPAPENAHLGDAVEATTEENNANEDAPEEEEEASGADEEEEEEPEDVSLVRVFLGVL